MTRPDFHSEPADGGAWALSVRAPWWWAILHLGKDIENRDWRTNHRGRILLHAGKWWNDEEVDGDLVDIAFIRGKEWSCDLAKMRASCGCIVGSVEIADCVSSSKSPWFFGRYGFVLKNPQVFENPIPFRGALGFFRVEIGEA
jgi:hypothetical protein